MFFFLFIYLFIYLFLFKSAIISNKIGLYFPSNQILMLYIFLFLCCYKVREQCFRLYLKISIDNKLHKKNVNMNVECMQFPNL